MYRREVLSVYRRIFEVARTWQAASETGVSGVQDTEEERNYIRQEARKLFRKNKDVTDPAEIKTCIEEANSRIEMAVHYRSPYPRLMNLPIGAITKSGKRERKAQDKLRRMAKPTYLHSYDEVDK